MTPEAQRIAIAEAVVQIPLTQGFFATVDVADYELVKNYTWRVKRNGRTNYAISDTGGGRSWMHKVVMRTTERVDHKDYNGLNNCRSNLQILNNTHNIRRKRPNLNGTSQYKGVSWYHRTCKWQATIKVNGKSLALGHFSTEIEAATAYDLAARHHFGEHCYQNFPCDPIQSTQ
jgi:hypothetical protein